MDGQAFGSNGIDSITLGQLKSLVGGGQNNVKQKVLTAHTLSRDGA